MTGQSSQAEFLIQQLDDPDADVRSHAAITLHQMDHPAALNACLQTLNDGEDILHLDYTPSVRCLSEIGQPALLPLLDFLLDEDGLTRLRAQRAAEGITTQMFGFDGDNWPEDQLQAWRKWWQSLDYDSDAGPEARQAAVDRLQAWAEENK